MNRVRSAAIVILTILIVPGIAAGQKKQRPTSRPSSPRTVPSTTKRPVVVNLTQGDQVRGTFLRADTETVQIEIERGRITLKLSEVASIVFTSEPTEAKTSEEAPTNAPSVAADPTLPAARKAYGALRKLAEAAQIRLPYGQYGSLLIEVRSVVEDALVDLQDSSFRNDIVRAMEAYTDAGKAWSIIQSKGILSISTEPGATLMKKYDIKPAINRVGQADRLELDTALNTIWTAAGYHINNLAVALRH